ncbi:hypothetical protein Trydic_g460, partial [Trypoxylus dichotomus]
QLFTGEKNEAERPLASNQKKPKFLAFELFPTHAITQKWLGGQLLMLIKALVAFGIDPHRAMSPI